MRADELLNAIGEIDEDLVDGANGKNVKKAEPENVTAIEKGRKTIYKKWLYAAASFVVAAVASFAVFGGSVPGGNSGLTGTNTNGGKTDSVTLASNNESVGTEGEKAYEYGEYGDQYKNGGTLPSTGGTTLDCFYRIEPRDWDVRTMCEKFNRFYLNGTLYTRTYAQGFYYSTCEITAEEIDEKISGVILEGKDDNTGTNYTAKANVYTFNGISADYAVAIKFDGYDEYYVYVHRGYSPKSLGDLVRDCNLTENFNFCYACKLDHMASPKAVMYEKNDYIKNAFAAFLSENSHITQKPEPKQHYGNTINAIMLSDDPLKLGCSMDLDNSGWSVYLTSDNCFAVDYYMSNVFYIGEEKITAFVNSLYENCPYEVAETYEPGELHDSVSVIKIIPEYEYINVE